jgi:hypothetical protein
MFIYINFTFDFLGLDNVYFYIKVTSPMNSYDWSFLSHLKHSQFVLYQIQFFLSNFRNRIWM